MRCVWVSLLFCLACVTYTGANNIYRSKRQDYTVVSTAKPGSISRQNIGDGCILSSGEPGQCNKISECRYAQNLLRNNQRPLNCGFLGLEPIVCCTDITTNLNSLAITRREPGIISRKECERMHPKVYAVLLPGGKPSLVKEFPHMSIIGYGESDDIQWLCGGSLISENFVLTAAHCLFTRDFGNARWVRIGDLDLSTDKDEALPQDFTVKRLIKHPDYKPPVKYHDIGLIELDRNVTLGVFVNTACLHTDRQLKDTKMVATGWGNTEFAGSSSSFLLKVDLDYVPNESCRGYYRNTPQLPNGIDEATQICAGGPPGSDTCQGDSGGPLQVLNRNRTFIINVHNIIGVTSFGKPCGLSTDPAVYTRVAYYVPWIEKIVWPNLIL